MSELFPIDIVGMLHQTLRDGRRPPDGKLHCSSDLVSSLRHSMLHAAGAPTIASELTQDMTLEIGTLIHKRVAEALVAQGVPFMQEVKLDPWLPEGWSGTADWIFYHPKHQAFVLGDLKTIKGEGVRFVEKDGPKLEHVYQLSAYWHALYEMGLPIIEGVGVVYLPKNDTPDKQEKVEPVVHEFRPIDKDVLRTLMAERWEATEAYLKEAARIVNETGSQTRAFLNEYLAPVQERVQAYVWNGKQNVFDVKLVPHWTAKYCPFPDELCDCSSQGTEKIGHYAWTSNTLDVGPRGWWEYQPRKGYEEIEPEVQPSASEFKKREPK